MFNSYFSISDHDKHLLLVLNLFCVFFSIADTTMTDNHSTDQNNNNGTTNVTDEKINELGETTHDSKKNFYR
jgi:hypothetical protein